MFSATVISGNSARFWKMRAVGRLLGPIPAMSWPPIRTLPSDGSRKPETVRRIVVLPQPDGPRNEKNSPPWISSVALDTAVNSPNRTVTWSSSTPALICLALSDFYYLPPEPSFHASPCEIKRDRLGPKKVSPGEPGLTIVESLLRIRQP